MSSAKCAICNVSVLDTESLKAHLQGKKHLRALQLEEQRRNAEEKGIYVRAEMPNFAYQTNCLTLDVL